MYFPLNQSSAHKARYKKCSITINTHTHTYAHTHTHTFLHTTLRYSHTVSRSVTREIILFMSDSSERHRGVPASPSPPRHTCTLPPQSMPNTDTETRRGARRQIKNYNCIMIYVVFCEVKVSATSYILYDMRLTLFFVGFCLYFHDLFKLIQLKYK